MGRWPSPPTVRPLMGCRIGKTTMTETFSTRPGLRSDPHALLAQVDQLHRMPFGASPPVEGVR